MPFTFLNINLLGMLVGMCMRVTWRETDALCRASVRCGGRFWLKFFPAHPEPWKAIGTQIQGLGRKQETIFIEPPTALGFALSSSRPRKP